METYTLKQLIFYLCMNRETIGYCDIDCVTIKNIHDLKIQLDKNGFCIVSINPFHSISFNILPSYSFTIRLDGDINHYIRFSQIDDDKFFKTEESYGNLYS